jgi:sulfate/thiosulfate transport system permease protein
MSANRSAPTSSSAAPTGSAAASTSSASAPIGSAAGSTGRARRLALRLLALGYLALLLLLPVAMIFYRTFEHGLGAVWNAITEPNAQHAFWLSIELVAIAVPLNTVFGIGIALLLERGRFRGRALLGVLIDLPFAISPIVVGLSLVLVYGHTGWFGNWLSAHGIEVIFSVPGMVLATAFVSLPFVARETIPVLRELGTDAEQAAATLGASPWQTFRRITLPAIRWGVVYGVVLTTARALGEFGAVSVVSGRIEGKTLSLPLYVQDRFENFDVTGAYTAAVVLALLAFATLIAMNLLTRRSRRANAPARATPTHPGGRRPPTPQTAPARANPAEVTA